MMNNCGTASRLDFRTNYRKRVARRTAPFNHAANGKYAGKGTYFPLPYDFLINARKGLTIFQSREKYADLPIFLYGGRCRASL